MPTRTPALRTLLRSSTAALRASSTQLPRALTQTQPQRRSTSPPPPYQARNYTLLAAPTQWTRFSTAYTYSSVRTFTSTPARKHASSFSNNTQTSPSAAQAIEAAIEEIHELYGTARDEFEIAVEETEKNTTYAPDDRAAAREELDRLLAFYNGVVEGGDRAVAEEVKRRVGQRVRELEQAVKAMEESAARGD